MAGFRIAVSAVRQVEPDLGDFSAVVEHVFRDPFHRIGNNRDNLSFVSTDLLNLLELYLDFGYFCRMGGRSPAGPTDCAPLT